MNLEESVSPEQINSSKGSRLRTTFLIAAGIALVMSPFLVSRLPKGASCDGQNLTVDFGIAGSMFFFRTTDGEVIGTYAGGPPTAHLPLPSGENIIFRAGDNEKDDSLDFNVVRIDKNILPQYAMKKDGSVILSIKVLPNASEVIEDCTGGTLER